MSSATCKPLRSMSVFCTLQSTEGEAEASIARKYGDVCQSRKALNRRVRGERPRRTRRKLARLLLTWVVATAGADHELLVFFVAGLDVDGAVPAHGFGSGGLIGDGVLAANIVSDGAADLVHLRERLGHEGDAAGRLSYQFKSAAGAAGALFAEQSDGIHGRAIFLLQVADSFFERLAAGIVFAVGDYEQD